MDTEPDIISTRSRAAVRDSEAVAEFFSQSSARSAADPEACVFTFGNPHEMPLPGLVSALHRGSEPLTRDWFAYKASEPAPTAFLAGVLTEELGLDVEPEDVVMTSGAFGAIALAFHLLTDPGDEVIIPLPGWFLYAPILSEAGVRPVEVPLAAGTYDLDLEAIDAAITPRTRVVVVNTPHNPTGRIYSAATLQALADLLERASARIGARIFILSDEPYRRIRFDGAGFTSPASLYPWTLIDYSYGKILLAPGQRLGYLALSPLLPHENRNRLREHAFGTQVALGWAFPSALMQHSVEALETVGIDIAELERKRDRMYAVLTEHGYDLVRPEGTFYLWGRAPGGDSEALTSWLADRSVYIMPGTLFHRPADFRICLTATEEMIERALPALTEASTQPWRASTLGS